MLGMSNARIDENRLVSRKYTRRRTAVPGLKSKLDKKRKEVRCDLVADRFSLPRDSVRVAISHPFLRTKLKAPLISVRPCSLIVSAKRIGRYRRTDVIFLNDENRCTLKKRKKDATRGTRPSFLFAQLTKAYVR